MPAFLFAVNRINMNYGEEVKLTTSEKLLQSYKVLCEWLSAREQRHLGKSTILNMVSIWEKNSGETSNVVRSTSTKSLVLNLEKF